MTTRYRAVLFDVDGTLYRQAPLRVLMAAELMASPLGSGGWSHGVEVARIVREYRRAHEQLRRLGAADRPLAVDQIARAAAASGVDEEAARTTVEEWMDRRPLKYLRWCRRPGLVALLDALEAAGVRLGVLSDYEPSRKLRALDVGDRFSLALCTTAERVNALKPHPKGFQVACEQMGLEPKEVLYVGDRPDVDGEGAMAAGLDCAIIGRGSAAAPWHHIEQLGDLREHVLHRT